jgi:hypothetical protein
MVIFAELNVLFTVFICYSWFLTLLTWNAIQYWTALSPLFFLLPVLGIDSISVWYQMLRISLDCRQTFGVALFKTFQSFCLYDHCQETLFMTFNLARFLCRQSRKSMAESCNLPSIGDLRAGIYWNHRSVWTIRFSYRQRRSELWSNSLLRCNSVFRCIR